MDNSEEKTSEAKDGEKLGNIEIAIESVPQEQLDQILDFIVEKS